jgi:hypothetical protein
MKTLEPRDSEDQQLMPASEAEPGPASFAQSWLDRADTTSAVCLRIYLRALYGVVLTAAAVFGVIALAHGVPPLPFLMHAIAALGRAWKATG